MPRRHPRGRPQAPVMFPQSLTAFDSQDTGLSLRNSTLGAGQQKNSKGSCLPVYLRFAVGTLSCVFPGCAKSLLGQILALCLLSCFPRQAPSPWRWSRTDAGWHPRAQNYCSLSPEGFVLQSTLFLTTPSSLRMNYFLGGSFIPLSKLKEVQKATHRSLKSA